MQSQRSLGGKTVEAEISKKRIALAHLKEVEERRLALEFQHEIDLNTRRNEVRNAMVCGDGGGGGGDGLW